MALSIQVEGPPVIASRQGATYRALPLGPEGERLKHGSFSWSLDSASQHSVRLRASGSKATLTISGAAAYDMDKPVNVHVAYSRKAGSGTEDLKHDFDIVLADRVTMSVRLCLVQDPAGGTQLTQQVREMHRDWTKRINEIWKPCGVRFRIAMQRGDSVSADPRWFGPGGVLNQRGRVVLHESRPPRCVCVYVVRDAGVPAMTWSPHPSGYGGVVYLSDEAILASGRKDADTAGILAHQLGHAAGGLPHLDLEGSLAEVAWTRKVLAQARINPPGNGLEGMLMSPHGTSGRVSDVETRLFFRNARRLARMFRSTGESLSRALVDKEALLDAQQRLVETEQPYLDRLEGLLGTIRSKAPPELAVRLDEAADNLTSLLRYRAQVGEAAEGRDT